MKDYPLIKFTLLFICGILLSPIIKLDLFLLFPVLIAALVLYYLPLNINKNILLTFFLASLIIFMGIFRTEIVKRDSFLPGKLHKQKDFSAFGTITGIELIKDREIEFYLSADSVKAKNILIGSKINLIGRIKDERKKKIDSIYNKILPGNVIVISGIYSKGREMRNPGEFDYNAYLMGKGISGIITAYNVKDFRIINGKNNFFFSEIFRIRKAIDKRIKELSTGQSASLLKGLLLADRSEIDYRTKTEFINLGVIHVLAVSGLHTGFIILFLLILFGRLNLYLRSIVTIIGLLFFMCITGLPVSVFRASVMAIVLIAAFIYNRSTNIFNSLALSALIILLVNPFEIYSPGFQLSFSAVLSIGAIFPLFQKKINRFRIRNSLLKYIILLLAVSLSVQIGTLPITVYYFGKLSIIALAANLIVIPLIGLIILVAITALLISVISPLIAGFYAAANNLFTFILFKLIKLGGNLDYSFVRISNFSTIDALLFFSLLILFIFYYKRFQSGSAKFILLFLVLTNFFLFSSLDNKDLLREGDLNILMIDVGQGDSFLIRMPGGETALIDAGEASYAFDNGERIVIPLLDYLGINKIDYGFVSHLDADHYGGFISLIHEKRIKKIFKPLKDSTDKSDSRFEKYLKESNIPFSYYRKDVIKLNNSRIYFLEDNSNNVNSKNDRSGIIKIVFGKRSFLFTGDAGTKREKILAQVYGSFLKSEVLKVSHHGSLSGSSLKFLNTVKPKYSLISAGIQNKFGHPAKKVLDRLKEINSKILRTDLLGSVLLRSNGDSVYAVDWKRY